MPGPATTVLKRQLSNVQVRLEVEFKFLISVTDVNYNGAAFWDLSNCNEHFSLF